MRSDLWPYYHLNLTHALGEIGKIPRYPTERPKATERLWSTIPQGDYHPLIHLRPHARRSPLTPPEVSAGGLGCIRVTKLCTSGSENGVSQMTPNATFPLFWDSPPSEELARHPLFVSSYAAFFQNTRSRHYTPKTFFAFCLVC